MNVLVFVFTKVETGEQQKSRIKFPDPSTGGSAPRLRERRRERRERGRIGMEEGTTVGRKQRGVNKGKQLERKNEGD